ncbi:MFS transporter [Chelativorans sp. SCAU2101]|mgnify:CR=1 FL=1|jgi:Fucose permease|uniref:MFS transporter n=1 Tax=Chelativorans petroleitrophicus TaxID=2975484 RepID=A0A9X3AYR6_9HYPH|nr:MFS transporter [Chelativorans petroleitrophicus]MCT8988820.1 MFS transporter [Chelativorans petroleitrophicus]
MPQHEAFKGRWAVAACFFVNGFMVGSWAPQIPLLVARFSLSESVLGLLILLVGVGAVTAMPVCGYLMSRYGSRTVLRVAGLLCAGSLLVVALAPAMAVLSVALIAFGGLIGGMDVSMNANAVAVERRLGRAIMSSSHGFWSLGGFVGAGLGGVLAEEWGYLAHAVAVTAIALPLVAAALPHLIVEEKRAPSAGGRFAGFPKSPGVYLVGLVALMCMIPEGAVLDWAALYLRQEMGASLAVASLAFTAFSGTMALMRFLGDRVRDRLGAVKTMRLSGIIAALGMLGAGISPSPLVATLAFALSGLGVANLVPIAFSAAGNQPGISSAAGMSVATTIGYSGLLAAPSLIGFVAETTGFAPIFIAFAMVLGLISLTSNLMRPADAILSQPAADRKPAISGP